jgi:hypothetical protein
MIVALLAVGLDPGIGMFHADIDRRSSLALDAIEAVRPHVDYWLFAYLASSAFANRDFTELPDGEVRLTHPLNSHLAHTAALWRKICEPVANWLARSLNRATDFNAALANHLSTPGSQTVRSMRSEQSWKLDTLTSAPPISRPARGRWPIPLQAALKDNPVPVTCWECGKALAGKRLMFCSKVCARAFPEDRLCGMVKV